MQIGYERRLYQDVTGIDCCGGLLFRGSRVVVFAGGAFALVFGLVAAFGCWFLVGCHVEFSAERCGRLGGVRGVGDPSWWGCASAR